MINKIIKDWVGEGLQSDSHIGIGGLHSADMEMAYNQALQDLTSRIPQLTERIVEEIEKIQTNTEMQDLYKRKNNEFAKRSLSGLLQIKLPIDTNKGCEFVYVTGNVERFILELVNSELGLYKENIINTLKGGKE